MDFIKNHVKFINVLPDIHYWFWDSEKAISMHYISLDLSNKKHNYFLLNKIVNQVKALYIILRVFLLVLTNKNIKKANFTGSNIRSIAAAFLP